jgi:phage-related protein
VSQPIQFTFPGNVTINIGPTADEIRTIINDALEATVTAPFANFNEALTALSDSVANLTAAEAADRAAFDALAAAVRAFIASLPPAGGALTEEQAAMAQAILAGVDAAAASDTQEAADEAALQGEVPTV